MRQGFSARSASRKLSFLHISWIFAKGVLSAWLSFRNLEGRKGDEEKGKKQVGRTHSFIYRI